MAIICPQCGAGYDVTLFEFGHEVRCECGRLIAYPGDDQRSGHLRDATPKEGEQPGKKPSSRETDP